MSISGIGGNTPVSRIASQPIQKQVPATPAKQVKADKVELSTVKQLLVTLKASGIRADKVAAIKAQIAAGTYETSAKLDAAIERLMNDLG